MFLLAALAAAQASASPMPKRAQATVQIVRAVRATKDECNRLPPNRRREVMKIEAGRPLTVRLIEFE